uniref:Uncharacterized protein n=1 Tax=Rhizophora mucronata TaxID=61149 RepID=A0A2P2P7A7_RHIMU
MTSVATMHVSTLIVSLCFFFSLLILWDLLVFSMISFGLDPLYSVHK